MLKNLVAIALVLVLLIITVNAFPVTVPSEVDIYDTNSFLVEITNPTNQYSSIEINFFYPNASVHTPSQLSPQSKTNAKIIVENNSETYNEVRAKLEVRLGNELEQRYVTLRFYPEPTQNQENLFDGNTEDFFSALFGLAFIGEFASFSLLEWLLFIVLVIIAAILVVAFVSRIVRRSDKKK